jgi:glycine dehydrogenase
MLTATKFGKNRRNLVSQFRYSSSSVFEELDTFQRRHIGPSEKEISYMLNQFGVKTLDEFTDKVVPNQIKRTDGMELSIGSNGLGETAALDYLKNEVASLNNTKVYFSFPFLCLYYFSLELRLLNSVD